ALGEETPAKSEDENRDAAKALVRLVHKIAKDNGIPRTEETLNAARLNLEKLKDDLGKPFDYEQQYQDTRARFDSLATELGDAIDNEQPMDPQPLREMATMIHEQSGDYASLPAMADSIGNRNENGQTQIEAHLQAIHNKMNMDEDEEVDMDDPSISIG